MDLNSEIKRISESSGLKLDSVKTEIDKLIAEGNNETAAMAIYKSMPTVKNRLGGRIINDAIIVPFRIDGPREVNTKRGSAQVANVDLFLQDNGKWNVVTIALWDEKVDSMKQYTLGKAMSAKVKTREGTNKVAVLEAPKPSTASVPSTRELADQVGTMPLDKIGDAEGETCFLKGIVGRKFTTDYGGGLELSALGADPVVVYVDNVDAIKLGEEVMLVGNVRSKDGRLTVRGSLLT